MIRLRIAIVAAAIACAPGSAIAGRRDFSWIYATETLPARGVDLEVWITDLDSLAPSSVSVTSLLVAPVVGITDQLELAAPIETAAFGNTTTLIDFGVEGRWRLVDADQPIAPLVRVAMKREVDDRASWWVEADAVLGIERGSLHAAVDVGYIGMFAAGRADQLLAPAAGVNVAVTDDLRVGVEGSAVIAIDYPERRSWYAVGPSVAWTHGRFWLAASVPIGIRGVDAAPRVTWAIAF